MTLLGKIFKAIASIFHGLRHEVKILIPIGINAVQALKTVMDSPVENVAEFVIKAAIPGEADDILIDKITAVIRKVLNTSLPGLQMMQSIADIDNKEDQLNAILAKLKLSSDDTKNIYFHGLASLIIKELSDGDLTWKESVVIGEYYYQHFVKGKEL
jgi:hypothetical protein